MKNLLSSAALLLLVSAPIHAQAVEPDTRGVYIGNDIGRINFASESKGAFGVTLGYRLNRHFALEGFARSFGDFLLDIEHEGMPTSHVGLGALGSVDVHERLRLYGRLGYGRSNVHSNTGARLDDNEASLAVGARFALGRHFGLKIEHTSLRKHNAHINSIGIDYQF